MSSFGRFLSPIRVSFHALSRPNSSLPPLSRNPFTWKYEQLKTLMKGLERELHIHASGFQSKLNMQRKCMHKFFSPGRTICLGSFLGYSFVAAGSLKLCPGVVYAADDEGHADFWDASGCLEGDPYTFWEWARKFWLPILLTLTVAMSWEHPVSLAIKVALFLFSTKPSPFSVYLFIEQLRRHSMRQNPGLYNLKFTYAKKVEVEDYKLLCLARVEFGGKKFTLIGILGSWWVLQSFPFYGAISVCGP